MGAVGRLSWIVEIGHEKSDYRLSKVGCFGGRKQ